MFWESTCKTPAKAVFSSTTVLTEWMHARLAANGAGRSGMVVGTRCLAWHLPPQNVGKINVDAALFLESATTGIGMVYRDSMDLLFR